MIEWICSGLACLPIAGMEMQFMQLALLGVLILAPLTAMMGVQVVNFRMAFYADAISHTAFTGVALGLLFGFNPYWTMPLFGVVVGVGIVALQRKSMLESDTIIGVLFSGVLAFGLAIVSRDRSIGTDITRFLYGDILTISHSDLTWLSILAIIVVLYQVLGFNRLIYVGLNPVLAETHRVTVSFYQYSYAVLLALVVIFAVWWVGVLLVTGMLILPAAAARNLSRSAGVMYWWALIISLTSAVVGLYISAQSWAQTATGATIVLAGFCWFVVSVGVRAIKK
ncbi:MAG: metal ABC transporter permease [Fibrobacterales bacterium]